MNIGVIGSCVSRDTCEYIPGADVRVYAARQSAVSLLRPHGTSDISLDRLVSPFQLKMVKGDLAGDALRRVKQVAPTLDLVLIDLADERRGFWLYPDRTVITNSLEAESSGIAKEAYEAGAQHVAFGTNQHFEMWKLGFQEMIEELASLNPSPKLLFLDIEWAARMENAKATSSGLKRFAGREIRKNQRRMRDSYRAMISRDSLQNIYSALTRVTPTDAEKYAERAKWANRAYRRYRSTASSMIDLVVHKGTGEVRIGANHKWGPQPFHYRESDYRSIVKGIEKLLNENDR